MSYNPCCSHSDSIEPAHSPNRRMPDSVRRPTSLVSARVDMVVKDCLQEIARKDGNDLSVVVRQALVARCGGSIGTVPPRRTRRDKPVRIIRSPAVTDVALLVALQTIEQSLHAILLNSCLGRSGSHRQDAISVLHELRELIRGHESALELPHEIG